MRSLGLKLLTGVLFAGILLATVPWTERRPGIVYFGSSARSIRSGESVTLSWETMGVTSVALEWMPENAPGYHSQRHAGLPPMGLMVVSPPVSTIYVLSCEESASPMCESASITVRVTK
jgi:hypothetical protein